MIKRRNPYLALALSFLPGLGQVYNGQVKKAAVFILLDLTVLLSVQLTGWLDHFEGFVALAVFEISFLIYRTADGFINARKNREFELKFYNRWYVYLLIAIGLIAAKWVVTGFGAFRVATPSMQPTLGVGDRVLANTAYYDDHSIRRGDIVVFDAPEGDVWIFRVIGLPNDSIEVRDGAVYLNDTLNVMSPTLEDTIDNVEVTEYLEQITWSKKIRTLRYKERLFPQTGTYVKLRVPDNEYFLMGDNRDNTYDSRFLGTIKREAIRGRVMFSYWRSSDTGNGRINPALDPQ